jgi:hypothetical protein
VVSVVPAVSAALVLLTNKLRPLPELLLHSGSGTWSMPVTTTKRGRSLVRRPEHETDREDVADSVYANPENALENHLQGQLHVARLPKAKIRSTTPAGEAGSRICPDPAMPATPP